jgi:hypothetical protein
VFWKVVEIRFVYILKSRIDMVMKLTHKFVAEVIKGKAVPLHTMEALGGRGGIAPTHSRPRR